MAGPFEGFAEAVMGGLGRDTAEVSPSGGSPRNVVGQFTLISDDDHGITDQVPKFRALTSDVFDLARRDTLTVRGVSYEIQNIQPTGRGLSDIMLQEI